MRNIHVVDGDSAEGSLRYAVQHHGIRGEVFNLRDMLSLGPLDSAPHRLAFLRRLFQPTPGFIDDRLDDITDTSIARWHALRDRCRVPTRIILWTSRSAADHVLLRMGCSYLQDSRAALWQVVVPALADGWEAVAVHPPKALARFAMTATALPDTTVARLACEYAAIAAHPEPLREIDSGGTLQYRPIDWHDRTLLECCPRHWTDAVRVVALAMGRRNPRNGLPDIFFVARIWALIEAGRIEYRSASPVRTSWWQLQLRRADG